MTPRTDIVAIAEDATKAEISQAFSQSGYSRLPVYRGTLDEIVGMLHAFDLFRVQQGSPLPVRPVAMAPASRACGDLLIDMQRERRLMAVVLDEYGGTAGIVTLDDLLESIVGEIVDDDEPGAAAGTGPGVFETDGSASREAIEARFETRLPPGRSASIGGLLVELAGRIPGPGERFVMGGLELDVVQASPTRVERILIRTTPPPAIALSGRTT
jgi:magnesium and cobalt transporter